MKTQTLSIVIICLAVIIAAGIVFGGDKIFKTKVNPVTVVSTGQDVESSGQEEQMVQKPETEFDRRQRIRKKYQSGGQETNFNNVFTKPIDKSYLLVNQFAENGSKYYADTFTALNTQKLEQISAEQYMAIKQTGVRLESKLNNTPINLSKDGGCTKIKLDNGKYHSFCNSTPENQIDAVTTYKGFYEDWGVHWITFSYEELRSSFVSQKDGRILGVDFNNHMISKDGNILVSYNPEFSGAYSEGGISFTNFKYWNTKGFLTLYGGYAGYERWGVDDVKIDDNNTVYFRTVAYSSSSNSSSDLEKIYSYFKQEVGENGSLSGILEEMKSSGFCEHEDITCSRVAGNVMQNSDGIKLLTVPFYHVENNIGRVFLAEPNTYEIYDVIDFDNPYSNCNLKGATNGSYVEVSSSGNFPETFKIVSAHTVDFDLKKFIEIDPESVVCYELVEAQ